MLQNITNLVAIIRMAVDPFYFKLVQGLLRVLRKRRYLNMGFYRAFTMVDLAQDAEAEFTLTATEALAIQKVAVYSTLGAAEIGTNLWIKIRVGDTTVIPSGVDLSGDGVQADRGEIPLLVFNEDAETTAQMLCLLTPGEGNQSTEAVITLINRGAAAINDAEVCVHGARVAPQRY